MKLDSYGIYFLSQAVMRRMPVSYLIDSFKGSSLGWDREQIIRLDWLKKQYPDYYKRVVAGDIDGSMLFLSSSNIEDSSIKEGQRCAVWVNGHRAGTAEYQQGREYSKIIVLLFSDMRWAEGILISEYPQFKSNLGKLTWVRRH